MAKPGKKSGSKKKNSGKKQSGSNKQSAGTAKKQAQPDTPPVVKKDDTLTALKRDLESFQKQPVLLRKESLIALAALSTLILVISLSSCPKEMPAEKAEQSAPKPVLTSGQNNPIEETEPSGKSELVSPIQEKESAELAQKTEKVLPVLKKEPEKPVQESRHELEQQIEKIQQDLKAFYDKTFAEKIALTRALDALSHVPEEDVVLSRSFYSKGKVRRRVEIPYIDYSDPLNPRREKTKITFTVDHGTFRDSPEKVLIDQDLPDCFRITAEAGSGPERMKPEGCQVIVDLKNISAKLAKERLLQEQRELQRVMPEKEEAYRLAAVDARKKIEALQEKLLKLAPDLRPQG